MAAIGASCVPENVGSQVRDLREVGRREVSPYGDMLSPYGHRCQVTSITCWAADGLRRAVHGRRLTADGRPRSEERGPVTTNLELRTGYSRPTAAADGRRDGARNLQSTICNLRCLRMGGDVKSAGGIACLLPEPHDLLPGQHQFLVDSVGLACVHVVEQVLIGPGREAAAVVVHSIPGYKMDSGR
jgi:hypothetical protein